MVDRYEYSSTFHGSSMEKRPEGDWVRAEDYDALVRALTRISRIHNADSWSRETAREALSDE